MPVRCRSTRLMAWGTWRRSGSSLVSRSSVGCSWCRIMTLSLYSLLVFQTSLKIFEPFWADGFNFFQHLLFWAFAHRITCEYFNSFFGGFETTNWIQRIFPGSSGKSTRNDGFYPPKFPKDRGVRVSHGARPCPWWRTMRWSWLMGDRCCRPSNWMVSWLLGRHGSGQTNQPGVG